MMTSGPFTLSRGSISCMFVVEWYSSVCVCIFFISTFSVSIHALYCVYTHTRIYAYTYLHVYISRATTFFRSIHPPVNTWVVIVGSSIISCLAEDDLAGRAVGAVTETNYESHALLSRSPT